jgi:predicted metal-binding protein
MKNSSNNLNKQLFVCCNTKQDDSGCAPKGAEGLRMRLKDRVQALKNPALKVTKCGCLGYCSEGIAAMVYP